MNLVNFSASFVNGTRIDHKMFANTNTNCVKQKNLHFSMSQFVYAWVPELLSKSKSSFSMSFDGVFILFKMFSHTKPRIFSSNTTKNCTNSCFTACAPSTSQYNEFFVCFYFTYFQSILYIAKGVCVIQTKKYKYFHFELETIFFSTVYCIKVFTDIIIVVMVRKSTASSFEMTAYRGEQYQIFKHKISGK